MILIALCLFSIALASEGVGGQPEEMRSFRRLLMYLEYCLIIPKFNVGVLQFAKSNSV